MQEIILLFFCSDLQKLTLHLLAPREYVEKYTDIWVKSVMGFFLSSARDKVNAVLKPHATSGMR